MRFATMLQRGLEPYLKPRILGTFGLGMSSGFPLTFVISLLAIWLSRFGVSREDVGLFALITSFYTWKFLWSPAIDRASLGPVTRRLGQRRGWLVTIMALMAFSLVMISGLDPSQDLYLVALLAALIAFLSASQDIVVDAYRIEIIEDDDQGYSAAAYVYGYRTANFLSAIVVLSLADQFGWSVALLSLPLFLLPGLLAIVVLGEPGSDNEAVESDEARSVYDRLHNAVVAPFKAFTKRPFWLLILVFILFFKAGDALAAIMTAPLIVDLGYSDLDIAFANKTVGFITLMLGVGLGAAFFKLIGIYPALMISGILMMVTNLGFAWLAGGDPEVWRLAVTIGLENFATGLGTTVTIAYMASLCDLHFTATQYALLSSLANQARTLLGAPSGFLAEVTGWVDFFVIATFVALPGLLILAVLWRLGAGQVSAGEDKRG